MSPALENVAPPKPYDWWANVLRMARIPFLVELREMILEQSNTRMPKWRVKYSSDLAAVIQPRPEFAVMKGDPVFLWIAAQGEHPAATWFEKPPAGVKMMKGAIRLRDTAWSFRPRAFWAPWAGGEWRWHSTRWRPVDPAAMLAFRDRILDALQHTHLGGESATTLLSPACMICGRRLTDPVSEARRIGPECAGRHPSIPVIRVPEPVR
jgi:hypothetical protein